MQQKGSVSTVVSRISLAGLAVFTHAATALAQSAPANFDLSMGAPYQLTGEGQAVCDRLGIKGQCSN